MFVVRESAPSDLESILRVAKHLDSYNLPYDRNAIAAILEASTAAFVGAVPVQDRAFTFVVENTETGDVVGTSMLYAQHGTHSSPHVYLDVLQDEHYSETLQSYKVHQALLIGYNYSGPTEIGGLIVLPEYRGHKESLGKLLSYARFLYIAINRPVFRDEVLSELLPRLEEDGTSRLWKHYGKRFIDLTYREADRLSKDNKEFIKSLFPHGMVYTALFPQDVQDEIGEVGPQTKGVEKMLERIGFTYAHQIDPFDGGPHFTALTDRVSLIADASAGTFAACEPPDANSVQLLVARPRRQDQPFRCCWALGHIEDAGIALDPDAAQMLGIEIGEQIWQVQP